MRTPKLPPQTSPAPPARAAWTPPRVDDLARLTDLTLTTTSGPGIPGGGGTGGGGSTVF